MDDAAAQTSAEREAARLRALKALHALDSGSDSRFERIVRTAALVLRAPSAAIILVDASKGVLTQTRRHTRLVALLGVPQAVLAVNKMDLVGWDAWNVTEDADLAFRLTRAGFTMSDLPSATLEEAPGRLRSWFRQRTRWMKGFIQTGVTHTRDPGCLVREAGWSRGACLLALCVGTVASALGYPFFLAATIATLAFHGVPSPDGIVEALLIGLWFVLIAAGLVAIIVPAALGARRRGLGDLTPWLLLLPVYHLLISAAAWAAVLEYLRAPFRWNKTEHGQAVTSRRMRGLITPP